MRRLLLGLGAGAALLAGLAIGAVSLGPAAILDGLLGRDPTATSIVRDLRLPRTLLAFVVGGGLSVAGAALQALVRNPLADPYLLGISGGAGLGAVAAIALGIGGLWTLPAWAFLGGLAALAVVYRLALAASGRLDPRTLILAGVVVGSLAAALTSGILVVASDATLRNAFLWLLGGFSAASWPVLATFLLYAAVPLLLLGAGARRLDLLATGEETALALGIDPERSRRLAYLLAGLVAGAAVAVAGIIGFVGLVVPHAVRRVVGPLHATLLPIAFVAGGSFLVVADVLARIVVRPVEMPVGIVTALVGVPLFAMLLRREVA